MNDSLNYYDEDDFDKLTGLAEKTDFIQKLRHACKSESGVLILINLDNFEIFNDVYGYDVGGQLLQKCADAINENTAPEDIKGQLGGDEFVCFIKGVNDRVSFTRLYKRVNEQISESAKKLVGEDMRISLGISIGVVFVPNQGDVYEELFRKADMALEHVKQTGGQGCAFYGNDESTVGGALFADNFELISKGLDGDGTDTGALWVDYDHFSIIYRFMRRYLQTYNGVAAKMLITVSPAYDAMYRDEFEEMTRCLGKVVNSTLRKSDLMMQSRQNQFFLLLPETNDKSLPKVSARIVENWKNTPFYSKGKLDFEAEMITRPD